MKIQYLIWSNSIQVSVLLHPLGNNLTFPLNFGFVWSSFLGFWHFLTFSFLHHPYLVHISSPSPVSLGNKANKGKLFVFKKFKNVDKSWRKNIVFSDAYETRKKSKNLSHFHAYISTPAVASRGAPSTLLTQTATHLWSWASITYLFVFLVFFFMWTHIPCQDKIISHVQSKQNCSSWSNIPQKFLPGKLQTR